MSVEMENKWKKKKKRKKEKRKTEHDKKAKKNLSHFLQNIFINISLQPQNVICQKNAHNVRKWDKSRID